MSLALLLPARNWPLEATKAPNVVWIVADYMSYGDIAPYGAPDVATPALDRLAAEGVKFLDAYAAAPICGPSRAALMTGLYPGRVGVENNVQLNAPGLAPEHVTVASRMREAGYRTALFGKWHLGQGESGPNAHGFDRFVGFHDWTVDYYSHRTSSGAAGLFENESPTTRDGYLTDVLTDEAASFVREHADKAFFVVLAYSAALPPYQPPGLAEDERGGRWQPTSRSDYTRVIEAMDAGIGRLLGTLDELGLADDTLVAYTHDHGGRHLARATPLFHGFSTLWEGGIRVPLILRWPGNTKAGTSRDEPVIAMDLTATTLDAAGIGTDAGPLDGLSLLPMLSEGAALPDRTLFWRTDYETRVMRAARRGRWKYIVDSRAFGGTRLLFDVAADPGERQDQLPANWDQGHALQKQLDAWETGLH